MIMLFSVFYIPFMSYVNYAGWAFRYMMIYYILIYCLAAAGIQAIVEKIGHRLWKPFAWIAATVITFSVVVLPMEYHLSERWGSREQDRSIRRALPEMESLIPENQAVLSPFLSQYSFLHDINVVNATLQFPDCASLHSIFKSYTVRFALFYGSHKGLPMLDQCCVLEEIWQKDGMILYSVSIR